jgi:hypothetical protein
MTDDRDLRLRGKIELRVTLLDSSGNVSREEVIDCNGYSLADVGTQAQRDIYELLRQVVLEVGHQKQKISKDPT